MTNQYSDKDYFTIQSALNQAAAGQQQAAQNVINRTDKTVTGNIDYFKQLADISSKLLAPYTALAQQSTPMLYDVLGLNGKAAQQQAQTQASDVFQQQGIYAAPLVSSIPGWSFNTAANQSASFINGMFGYGTNQPTEQVSSTVKMPGLYGAPQKGSYTAQTQAQNPWNAPSPYQAYNPPQQAFDGSSFDKQIAAVNASKAAEQAKIDQFNQLQTEARNANKNYLQTLSAMQQAQTGGPVTADSQYNILSNKLSGLDAAHQAAANKLNDYIKANNLQLTKSDGANPYSQQASLTGNYDAQIAKINQQRELAQLPQTNGKTLQASQQRTVGQGPTTQQVPVLNQPALQNQQNNELIGFTNQFKNTQADVQDVAGNTQGALNQILGNAAQFGNTALGNTLQTTGNNLLNRFNNTTIAGLAEQANNATSNLMSNDLAASNRFLQAVQNEVANRPNAAAEAAQITQSGLNLGNQQVAPLTNRANSLMDRYMPSTGGDFVQNTLNKLIDPATGAVNNWINSDVVKNVMDAAVGSGTNAVQNAAAARGMLDSGQTLAELQKVGTNAAGQYIVPYAGQLANNVLSQGAQLAGTELQTGVNAAQNMYGLANQQIGNVLSANTATANNRLNNYYNLLGKGMDFANTTAGNRNSMFSNLVNTGAQLGSTAGQLGAGMLTADQSTRANLIGQSMGVGNNLYNTNLNARTGMAGQGLNFANNLAQMQTGMTQNLANQYAGIGNQFANTLQNNANSTANQQNALQQGGLANLLSGGQQASTNTANIYSGLGGNVANQINYGNDVYGNATMYGANVEANRLNQAAQLQVLMDQYDRAKKAQSFGTMFNGGGLALSLGAMALGGGL